MTADLPRRQQQLHDLLLGRGDVPIPDIYAAMKGCLEQGETETNVQYMQRWLGTYITALNRKLAERNLRVEPGALKNTYRLVSMTT